MRRKRLVIISLVLLFLAAPAFAVFNEKDLAQTLSVLRYELAADYSRMSGAQANLDRRDREQHRKMIKMMKKCNELSLILYSQKQDYTFDMTYALKEVTREYDEFNSQKLPFDDILARLDLEIERYSRLVESLRRLPPRIAVIDNLPDSLQYHNDSVDRAMGIEMHHSHDDNGHLKEGLALDHDHDSARPERQPMAHPGEKEAGVLETILGGAEEEGRERGTFVLDAQGCEDRDSCLFYAASLLKMYSTMKTRIVEDNEHYTSASVRLKESYDYAQARYKLLQKKIFIDGQENYLKILKNFKMYSNRAHNDVKHKYSQNVSFDNPSVMKSEWKGPAVFTFVGLIFLFAAVASLLSLAIVITLNKTVKRFKGLFSGYRARCLALLLACAFLAITLMSVKQFAGHNFFSVACPLLLMLAWLVAAILLSLYIRLSEKEMKPALQMYSPVIVAGLLIIIFRIVFIPNSAVNLVLTPLMILFMFWQARLCLRKKGQIPQSDLIMGWIAFAVFAAALVISAMGYVFIAILLLIWWLFQSACVATIVAAYELITRYEADKMTAMLVKANGGRKPSDERISRGDFVHITWFFDMINMAVIPLLVILSLPFCLSMAADVFDFTEIFREYFYSPLIALYDTNANPILHISLFKIVLMASLFFVFKYVNYIAKAIYRDVRIAVEKRRKGGSHVHSNEVNLTLAYNVISIFIWGVYIATLIVVWKIPIGAISVVFAGLATGIGLAMKDILNNFIYGIQLMSGRLRVGDYVECDGIRGKVTAISYQSTQIETVDGAVMSFLNADLFAKNFKNLTRNNNYELVKIVVGVGYGTDVAKVREVLSESLKEACTKDAYNRDIVDPRRGLTIAFEDFGDSSVDIAVKQHVLVSERAAYIARVKEIIYNTLNENGIEIPFPQRDVHIITGE